MKRFYRAFVLCAALAYLCFATVACSDNTASARVLESADTYVVIEAEETGGSLEDALSALKHDGSLTYDGAIGDFGLFITSLNGRVADSTANEYWAIYTTLGEYDGVVYSDAEYGTYEWKDKTLSSASYGAAGIVMVKGEIYIITLMKF